MCFCSWFEADAKLKAWLSHTFNFASAQRASVNSTKKTIDLSWLNWHDFSFFYWQTSGKRPVFDSDKPSEVLTAWFGCEATHFNHSILLAFFVFIIKDRFCVVLYVVWPLFLCLQVQSMHTDFQIRPSKGTYSSLLQCHVDLYPTNWKLYRGLSSV